MTIKINMQSVITWVLAAILVLPAMLLLGGLHGFIVATLWGWFAVPLGAPAIGLVHAFGLGVLVNCIKPTYSTKADIRDKYRQAQVYAGPFFALALGYIAHLFMV